MHVTKCDLCEKEIKDRPVIVARGFFTQIMAELCQDCSLPISQFLEEKKLIKK